MHKMATLLAICEDYPYWCIIGEKYHELSMFLCCLWPNLTIVTIVLSGLKGYRDPGHIRNSLLTY